MKEHNKNFYSLEELKRTRDNLEGYLDNEEVYYFVGAIRYACDEIERQKEVINGMIDNEEKYLLEINKLKSIIKEVREILKYHLSNPSGTKNGWHIDIWNSEDINKLNENLRILDKGNK